MKELIYTTTSDLAVEFHCPHCQYENKSYAYKNALIYSDELDGICASCKAEYTLIKE